MTLQYRDTIDRAILDAISDSGSIVLREPHPTPHPRRYLVKRGDQHSSIWVYCWRLTPGGRPSLPHEYRIQMTSVQSPLSINPNGHTLLLGYEPDRGVFAAYDLSRHTSFTTGSPSIQVNIGTINRALQDGISFETKSNDEIVAGVRSDLLYFYSQNSVELHRLGEDATALDVVERASHVGEVDDGKISQLTPERQRVVQETTRWTRSASFRRQVLNAYDNRCAVTRQQLRLVDAAHILPVKAGTQSIDNVRNGIALSPTYHRAFDNGLIYLDQEFEMKLNFSAVEGLRRLDMVQGLNAFEASLGAIHLPFDPQQRPDPYFIHLANEYRGLK